MKFSAFAKFGHLSFTSQASYAETIYKQITGSNSLGVVLDFPVGSNQEAIAYSEALSLARCQREVDRGFAQGNPATTTDLLGALERDHRLSYNVDDTVADRRARLLAQKKLSGGATRINVERTLSSLLGDDFIAYYQSPYTGLTPPITWPDHPEFGPGLFGSKDLIPKLFTFTSPISTIDSPVTFQYSPIGAPTGNTLKTGDIVSVQLENLGLAEKVTITATGSGTATATFTKSHDIGATIAIAQTPMWTSNRRYSLIVVSSAASLDASKRQLINRTMQVLSRGVSTWAIVGPGSGTTTIPFAVGSLLGTTTVGSVTYT